MNLYGKKVILRALEMDDMKQLRITINDPEIEKMVGGWSFPISKRQQEEWYEKISRDKEWIRFAIDTKEDGFIGMADLRILSWKNRVASNGIKLCKKEVRRKGYGTDTIYTIMKYAFEELQLNRIETTILDYNLASQNLYIKKCGWSIEGTLRESVFKFNKYHNQFIVSILKEDYMKLGYWNE